MMPPRRRSLLATALALPWIGAARADTSLLIGALMPLTGAGSAYGPAMREMAAAVVRQANEQGGILGRFVKLVAEDDQTNPDAGVRAARKLIDVDNVAAIIGTWSSAVTTAVAPLCWESRTFLTTVSGADQITLLPHRGFLIRTQPNADLQAGAFVRLIRWLGATKPYFLGPDTPYAEPMVQAIGKALAPDGITMGGALYDATKSSYRPEIDTALRGDPDLIMAGGYGPDTAVLLRELSRAGYKGRVIGFAYAINDRLLAEQPREVTEGAWAVSPAIDAETPSYKAAASLVNRPEIDGYAAQVYDQANLVLLSMQLSGEATGTAVKDTVRLVSQGDGPRVTGLPDGLAALREGDKALDYDGASGPCTFDSIGDILDARFRYDRVTDGKLVQQSLDAPATKP